MSAPLSTILLGLIVLASLALMLWRPRGVSEAWWICGGVALLLAIRILPLHAAARAVGSGMDVYLFLAGMMLLSEIAREQGVFDWLAAYAVRRAGGSRLRLFAMVYAAGTVVTAFMSNDATAVVLTPAVLAAIKKSGDIDIDPAPYLFACAMVANAASFLLPIANPANLVVFATRMPALGQWLHLFLLPAIAALLVTFAVLRWRFRQELAGGMASSQPQPRLSSCGRMALVGIGCMSVVLLTASGLHWQLGLPALICSLLLLAVVSTRGVSLGRELRRTSSAVSWSVLPLVAGLFCLVAAVERAGLARVAVHALQEMQTWPRAAGVYAAGFGIAALDNLVNNLPVGLLAGAAAHTAHVQGPMANAVLVGVDMGSNLSVTGSLATILWLMRVRKEGVPVSGAKFLRVGAIVMPLALLAALSILLLMHGV